jgi:hypothetical protein
VGKTKEELFQLDRNIHLEADLMLKETGLGKIISEAGYKPVGSYVMQTMTWRDLDFERSQEPPNWKDHWELGNKFSQLGFIWKYSCVDAYNDCRKPPISDNGLYWGLQFDYPKGGPIWKIDLWTARESEWEPILPKRLLWMSKLTNEARHHILEIKDAVWNLPEYRQTLLSVHIYEAVLECNIHTLEEFREWWQIKYGK